MSAAPLGQATTHDERRASDCLCREPNAPQPLWTPWLSVRGVPSGLSAPPASQYGVPPSNQALLPFWKFSGTSLPQEGWGTPTLGSHTHPPFTTGAEKSAGSLLRP